MKSSMDKRPSSHEENTVKIRFRNGLYCGIKQLLVLVADLYFFFNCREGKFLNFKETYSSRRIVFAYSFRCSTIIITSCLYPALLENAQNFNYHNPY